MKGAAHVYRLYVQSFIVNLLLYVPCFQIDQLLADIKLYISLTDSLQASRSQLFSTCYMYTSTIMIFHNITSFLSYVTVGQTISFQFDINTL
mgnify:CR=1 FL=1